MYQYLDNPEGITRDKNNNIWVANTGTNDIFEFNDNLGVAKTISGHGLNQPYAVAIDSSGDIWAANYASNDVLEFSSSGTLLATLGGSGHGSGEFQYPSGLTFDPNGDLWVSDSGNNRLVEYTQTIPGDANLDGRVDINDLTIVLANYGKTGQTWTQGAMDGDPTGTVNINDLTIVLASYGDTVAASGGRLTPAPEPRTLPLVAAGVTSLVIYAGWRCKPHGIPRFRARR